MQGIPGGIERSWGNEISRVIVEFYSHYICGSICDYSIPISVNDYAKTLYIYYIIFVLTEATVKHNTTNISCMGMK